jgi:hypothetical protein
MVICPFQLLLLSMKSLRHWARGSTQAADPLSICSGRKQIMATGAKPALESTVDDNTGTPEVSVAAPVTLKEMIIRKLTEIFQHNEHLGVTRQY